MNPTVTTAIEYGLEKTTHFVDTQLEIIGENLKDPVEYFIISQIVDNLFKNMEFADFLDFVDNVADYCEIKREEKVKQYSK